MAEEAQVVVYVTKDETDAAITRAVLVEAGIPVLERPQLIVGYDLPIGRGYSQLLVNAGDELRARQLLEAYERQVASGAFAIEGDDEDDEE